MLETDWPTYLGNFQRTGYRADSFAPPLLLAWKRNVKHYIWESAIIIGDQAYITPDGVRAIGLRSGRRRWESEPLMGYATRSVTADAENIYVCGSEATYAVNQQTGLATLLLQTWGRGSSPCVSDDMMYWTSCSRGPKVYFNAFNLNTGQMRWQIDAQSDAGYHFSPSIADDTVYFSSHDCLHALDKVSGETKWQWRTSNKRALANTVAIAGEVILVAVGLQGLYALAAATGQVIWEHKFIHGAWSSPTVAPDGKVYVVGDLELRALDLVTGQQLWSAKGGFDRSAPVIIGDHLYIGSGWGHDLAAFERHRGTLDWTYPFKDLGFSTAAYAYGRLLIGSHDGFMYCFVQA